jgi:hypothetical protein
MDRGIEIAEVIMHGNAVSIAGRALVKLTSSQTHLYIPANKVVPGN